MQRTGAGGITLQRRREVALRDCDQGGRAAVGLRRKPADHGPVVAAATERDRDQVRQDAAKVVMVENGFMHPGCERRLGHRDGARLAADRGPQRGVFSRFRQRHHGLCDQVGLRFEAGLTYPATRRTTGPADVATVPPSGVPRLQASRQIGHHPA